MERGGRKEVRPMEVCGVAGPKGVALEKGVVVVVEVVVGARE